jgi:hypothetical protein
MAFKLKPGTKEIDSIGNFSQRATNMLKQFAKNFLEGSGSSIGALKGIHSSYGADLKKGIKAYRPSGEAIEAEARRFNDSLRSASKRKLEKLK